MSAWGKAWNSAWGKAWGAITKVASPKGGKVYASRDEDWIYYEAKRKKAIVEKLIAELQKEAPALVETIQIPRTTEAEPDWQSYVQALGYVEIRLRTYLEMLEQDDEDVFLLL